MAYFRKVSAKQAAYLSAAHPGVATKYLPPIEEDMRRAQLMEDVFSTTNRAGAGTKASTGYAIRPRGMRAYKMIDENFTPGKYKERARPLSQPLNEPRNQLKREIAEHIGMILPRNFCPDCGEINRPHDGGVINVNRYDYDRPDLHIKANALLISFFCQECGEKQTRKQKNKDAEDELIFKTSRGEYKKGELDAGTRLVRIKNHTESFIKSRILSDDKTIFPDGRDPYGN